MELERDELHENYKALQEGTGESWESILSRVEGVGDKKLAAELRSKYASGKDGAKKEPPQERRSTARKPVTADGGDK